MGFLVRQVVFVAPDDDVAAGLLHPGPPEGVVCDPGPVGLWSLEALLAGRPYAEVAAEQPEPVALFHGGQRFVLPLSTALRDQLASVRGWRASRVARGWARTDEVRAERLTRADTHKLLYRLHLCASTAANSDSRLYLWVDVDERALF
ncbi:MULTISPECIES: hypothetical protein [Microbacterium]|uniref:hypothetical protein n=1 Tax=Microbacterium TaxID=33882 RepID=UPI0013A57E1E|nr:MULTISPECIES: hypothetical protein [Microbacterium]